MTKIEYEKAEKLMEEAIRKASESKEDFNEYERLLKEGKKIEAECKMRVADQELGYAEGINQTLISIGFKHERMKELTKLL